MITQKTASFEFYSTFMISLTIKTNRKVEEACLVVIRRMLATIIWTFILTDIIFNS